MHGLAIAFQKQGIEAVGIDSTMKLQNRRKILKGFYNGRIKVLLNCGILTEGFDCPQIDCILLVRPTRSELLLRQMIGRGTRHYPSKDNCKVVDFVCVSDEWDLISPAELFGFTAETQDITSVAEQKESQERSRKQFGKVEFNERIAGIYDTRSPGNLYWQKIRWKGWILRCGADGEIRILPQSDTLKTLDHYYVQYNKKWKTETGERGTMIKILDNATLDKAFAFAESYCRENDFDISVVKDKAWWHAQPATEAQLKYIRGLGAADHIKPNMTKREASDLITFYKDLQEYGDE